MRRGLSQSHREETHPQGFLYVSISERVHRAMVTLIVTNRSSIFPSSMPQAFRLVWGGSE
jgi:hypothetical protein